jgi:hypothetical protein
LSEYFGVSTDYLLGLSEVKTTNENMQATIKLIGLSEAAVNELSDMPTSDASHGQEHASAMNRQVETMTYRGIINLLLTNERGKKALKFLASYYFARLNSGSIEDLPAFILPFDLPGGGGTWLDTATFNEDLLRDTLLELSKGELKNIRRDRKNAALVNNSIRTQEEQKGRPLTEKEKQKVWEDWAVINAADFPGKGIYTYTKPAPDTRNKMQQAAYDACNPHIKKDENGK